MEENLKPILELSDLAVERQDGDRLFTLHAARFQLYAGDRVALVAPSGGGKSTFLETVACARVPQAVRSFKVTGWDRTIDVADVWYRDKGRDLDQLRGRYFGYVPQSGGLLEFLSIRNNIMLTQHISNRKDPARIVKLAEALGITSLLNAHPRHLSGGQKQRVAIARAVAHYPAIIVADEPTAALDKMSARIVMSLLCEQAKYTGAALLIATHDVALAEEFNFALWGFSIDNSGKDRAVKVRLMSPGKSHIGHST